MDVARTDRASKSEGQLPRLPSEIDSEIRHHVSDVDSTLDFVKC